MGMFRQLPVFRCAGTNTCDGFSCPSLPSTHCGLCSSGLPDRVSVELRRSNNGRDVSVGDVTSRWGVCAFPPNVRGRIFSNQKLEVSWDAIWRGLPKWAVRVIQIGGIFFAAHFVLFLVQSHAASPEIMNGVYVLNNHGHIVKELTESQYRWLKGSELRLFATGWLSFYLALALYWWFPRRATTQRATA